MKVFAVYALVCAAVIGAMPVYGAVTPEVEQARRAYDQEAFVSLTQALEEQAKESPENFDAQFAAAECLSVRADFNRRSRFIEGEDESKRAQQNKWADEAMPYAERALELAETDTQKAQAHRLIGELYSHQITGMISGMRNGPKSKKHIEAALELCPDDPECQRALGLMYLYNPSVSGGDPAKAVEVFTVCTQADPQSDAYQVLLAMAYRKADQKDQACTAAEAALSLNPQNLDAQHLLAACEES